jgi:hypothetical protein
MSNAVLKGNASGTGTVTIETPNTNSDLTISMPAAAGTMMVSGNMPAFSAVKNATQAISAAATTKILFQTEEFDTNSSYDTSNSRFTPTVAGYYQVTLRVRPNATNGEAEATIYKNGSNFKDGSNISVTGTQNGTIVSALIYLNGTTDYVEGFCYVTNACTVSSNAASTYFQAVMVRAA